MNRIELKNIRLNRKYNDNNGEYILNFDKDLFVVCNEDLFMQLHLNNNYDIDIFKIDSDIKYNHNGKTHNIKHQLVSYSDLNDYYGSMSDHGMYHYG